MSEIIKLLREKHSKQITIHRQNCSIFFFSKKFYNLSYKSSLKWKKGNTAYFGSEKFISLQTKMWELVTTKNKKK